MTFELGSWLLVIFVSGALLLVLDYVFGNNDNNGDDE